MRNRIRGLFAEGARSIVGTPRTKTGKQVAKWLFAGLFTAAFVVGIIIFAKLIGYP